MTADDQSQHPSKEALEIRISDLEVVGNCYASVSPSATNTSCNYGTSINISAMIHKVRRIIAGTPLTFAGGPQDKSRYG